PQSSRIDNAPALKLITALWAQGAEVHVHDPRALPALAAWAGERDDLVLHDDPYEAAAGADALMLVTEWKSYWSPDFKRLHAQMNKPLLLDGRNVWDPGFVKRAGFTYYGIGRRSTPFAPGAGAPTVREEPRLGCKHRLGANRSGMHSHPGRVLLRFGGRRWFGRGRGWFRFLL